ncbi:MAG: methionine synthase [Armatimonadota bacterium]|nr:methionine synthase [Armatimonadota bacterium]MDR7428083.1 methionine synthase [Armatimonadota bacterium]MDR7464583.1 methionine synthase [Armatimonadota bacterium]MDR7476056.1 methionine synthase [Armatimonadota bacterium]
MGALPPFLPTAVGSLPHTDPGAACDLVVRWLPELPAWPQLPRRDARERLPAQFCRGFPGVVLEGGRVYVDRRQDLDAGLERLYARYLSKELEASALDGDFAAGLERFLTLRPESALAVKGQVLGPVSWGLTVTDQDRRALLYDEMLADAAARYLHLQAAWQERALRRLCAQTIIFVDEPYLAAFGSAYLAVEREEVQKLLEEVLAGIEGLKGVHCCGNTDWSLLLETSVDILNFDAYDHAEALSLYPQALRAFLDRGGIIAWGIVPTGSDAQVMAESVGSLTERLWGALRLVASKGVPLDDLLAASLLTPACGLGTLSEAAASRALELLSGVSAQMRKTLGGEPP